MTRAGCVLIRPHMPIYEYRCDRCGEFEVTQRITEPALADCPTCSGPVARLISATSFQLKGSGWYVTDYARKGANGGKAAAPVGGGEASGASAESGGSGAKPASDTAPSAAGSTSAGS